MPRRLFAAAVALAALIALQPTSPAAADGEVFRFADAQIVESSSLVDLGSVVVTANDSGHPPNVYVVDAHSGQTVGITYLHTPAVDIEAMVYAGHSRVWVGDIGDNARQRRFISLYLAPVAHRRLDVQPHPYNLVYPDGPHDAESLFTDPTGRLYVVTKSVTGGAVYRAPARLDTRYGNRLQKIADVADFATDAAMMPDGKHVIIRSYGLAGVYTFPDFHRVGSFALPAQQQGEGISVGHDGRILLSSEGVHAPVLQVSLPTNLTDAMAGKVEPTASPTPTPATSSDTVSHDPAPDTTGGVSLKGLRWSVPLVLLVGAVGIGLALRRRRE